MCGFSLYRVSPLRERSLDVFVSPQRHLRMPLEFQVADLFETTVVDTYGIGVHIWDFNPIHIIGAHNVELPPHPSQKLGSDMG